MSKMTQPGDAKELAERMIEAHANGETVSYTSADIGVNGSLSPHADGYEIASTEYEGECVTLTRVDTASPRDVVLDDNSFAFIGK